MTETNLIVNLPTALSSGLLHDWLITKEVVALDSAFCTTFHRQQFLSLFQIDRLVFNEPLNLANVKWFAARRFATSKLIVGSLEQLTPLASYLSRHGSVVKSVEIVPGTSPEVVSLVASRCQHLTHVTLRNGDIITPEFRDILVSNPNLQDLRIVALRRYDQTRLPNRNTASFASILLPNLRLVSFDHFQMTAGQIFDILVMSNNIQVVHIGEVRITSLELGRLAEFCPHLLSLSLAGIPRRVDDSVVAAITRAHPGILHLDLEAAEISDEAILSVATNLKGLRGLNISHCANLTSKSIEYLYTHCADTLHTLYLTSTSDAGPVFEHRVIANLLSSCTHLRSLGWLETVGYQEPIYKFTYSISNLTEIALGWEALCDENLMTIGHYCALLHTLTVTFPHESHSDETRQYSHSGFTALLQNCALLQNVVMVLPMYKNDKPHPTLMVPYLNLMKTLRPELKVYWKDTHKNKFYFNVLSMSA